MIKVAIVDDHQPAREKLKKLLSTNPLVTVLAEASNGVDFINTYEWLSMKPDIAIIDYIINLISGISVIHFFHKYFPKVKLLRATGNDDTAIVTQVFAAGADGYIYKFNLTAHILYQALENIINYQLYIHPLDYILVDMAMAAALKATAL